MSSAKILKKVKYLLNKDGFCKYEGYCSFAHGDTDLRKKNDNTFMQQMPINPQLMQMYPQYMPTDMGMMFNPYQMGAMPQAMDLSQMYGFPQQMQGMPNMQNRNYNMYGNDSLNINPNDTKNQETFGGNSNLSNLNTINNIYPQKYQK